MFFERQLRGIQGVPQFNSYLLKDINPLSGNVKTRLIHNPNKPMRDIHSRFITWLRKQKIPMPNAVGGIRGMSPLVNVMRHKVTQESVSRKEYPLEGNQYVIDFRKPKKVPFNRYFFLTDIRDAYGSVQGPRLADILWFVNKTLPGNQRDVLDFLAEYFISRETGGLLVGAPASPDLFNLYCEMTFDGKLRKLCRQYDLTYTRYLDDLTFSNNQSIIGRKKRRTLLEAIQEFGFAVNDRKTHVHDLYERPIIINGIGIRYDGSTFMPQHAARALEDTLRAVLRGEPISTHVIHGRMGILKHTIDRGHPTALERRIFKLYERFRVGAKRLTNA